MGELPECVKQFNVALRSNDIERAEDLLKQNPGLIQKKAAFGNWVHLAIRFRYFNTIEFLISRGVGISELDAYGRNALSLVACTGDFEAFKLIYALGAPIDTETALRNLCLVRLILKAW
jgi:hypothetical protein